MCRGSRPPSGLVTLSTDVSQFLTSHQRFDEDAVVRVAYWRLVVTSRRLSLQIQSRLSVFLHKEKKKKIKHFPGIHGSRKSLLFVAFKWPDCCPPSACRLSPHTRSGESQGCGREAFFFLSLSLSSGSGYCGAAALDAAVSICFLVAFFCIRPHGIAIPLCDLRRVPQHLTLLAQNSILFFWK